MLPNTAANESTGPAPSGGGEIEDLLAVQQGLLRDALREFDAAICVLLPVDPITGRFSSAPLFAGELLEPDAVPRQPPADDTLPQLVLARGQVLVEDLAAEPFWQGPFSRREGIAAFAALALATESRNKNFAVLSIAYRQPRKITESDRDRLQAFASRGSSLLQIAWSLGRYRKVVAIGHKINQGFESVESLYDHLVKWAAEILDTSYFFMLAVHDGQSQKLDLYFTLHGKFQHLPNHAYTAGCRRVIEQKRPLLISNYAKEAQGLGLQLDDLDASDPTEPQSLVLVPLLLRGIPRGVLSVQHLEPDAYDREDLRIIELVADHVASALAGIRLLENLTALNQMANLLTRQLDIGAMLDQVVEKIREQTRADLVILYPYDEETRSFHLPPKTAGELLRPDFPQPTACLPGHVPLLTVNSESPRFFDDATVLADEMSAAPQAGTAFQRRERVVSVALSPLRVGGEAVGALFVNYRHPQEFGPAQRIAIELAVVLAAAAVMNARRSGRLSERHRLELEILQQIDVELSRAFLLGDVLRTILDSSARVVKAGEHSAILLFDGDRGQLRVEAVRGPRSDKLMASPPPTGSTAAGLARWAFDHKQPVRVGNVRSDPQWQSIFVDVLGDTLSELDVPLLDGAESVGVINFESPHPDSFTVEDEQFVRTLAGQVVVAVKKAQIYATAERRALERGTLIEIGRRMIGREELLNGILEKAIEITKAAAGVVLLFDENRQLLVMRAEVGAGPKNLGREIPLDLGIVGVAARERRTLNIDPADKPWNSIYLPYVPDSRSELAVPLVADGRLLGVLNLESPIPNLFQSSQVYFAEALAVMTVVALQGAETYEAAVAGRQRLEAIRLVSRRIVRHLDDPDGVMKAIVRYSRELTHADLAVLDLWQGGRLVRTYTCTAGENGTSPVIHREDVDSTVAAGTVTGAATGFQSEVKADLVGENGHLVGVLKVDSQRSIFAPDQARALLELFADEAVIAIQHARGREYFLSLLAIGRSLAELKRSNQHAEACELVTKRSAKLCGCVALVRLHDRETDQLVLVHWSGSWQGTPHTRMGSDEGVNGWVFKHRRTRNILDTASLRSDDPIPKLADPATRSLLVTPIFIGEVYFGNLSLSSSRPYHFHDAEVQLAEGLAEFLAVTLARLDSIGAREKSLARERSIEAMGSAGKAWLGLGHLLGNKLGSIPFFIDIAREALARAAFADPDVERSLTAIGSLTNSVLEQSRALKKQVTDEFKLHLRPQRVPVKELMESIRIRCSSLPDADRIVIQAEPELGFVEGVAEEILEILENLINNAREAIGLESGVGTVTVSARNVGYNVEIAVGDDGPGIPASLIAGIFEQGVSTKNSSGIGLWLASTAATANGGTLSVASKLGAGATFTLTLPRADREIEARYPTETAFRGTLPGEEREP